MTAKPSSLTLAACVAVTVAAIALYVVEPKVAGTEHPIDVAAAGQAPSEHRVAALDEAGHVVQIDDRTGAVAVQLRMQVDVTHPEELEIERLSNGSSAFVTRPRGDRLDPEIDLVHLDTGGADRFGDGRRFALSPDEETLAMVRTVDGSEHLVMQNVITGHERDLGAGAPGIGDVRAMAWTADGGQLLLLTDTTTRPLWRVDRNADSFGAALEVPLPPNVSGTIDAITPYAGGIAAAVRSGSSTDSTIVRLAASVPGGGDTLFVVAGAVRSLDSNSAHDALLLAVDDGAKTLVRWDGSGDPKRLADGVVAAAW